jgi:hypothetical protein
MLTCKSIVSASQLNYGREPGVVIRWMDRTRLAVAWRRNSATATSVGPCVLDGCFWRNEMDWEFVAPLIFSVVLVLTVGGVILLRVYARERSQGVDRELAQMRNLLESMDGRLRLIEDRQDFAERLLSSKSEELEAPDAATRLPTPGQAADRGQ